MLNHKCFHSRPETCRLLCNGVFKITKHHQAAKSRPRRLILQWIATMSMPWLLNIPWIQPFLSETYQCIFLSPWIFNFRPKVFDPQVSNFPVSFPRNPKSCGISATWRPDLKSNACWFNVVVVLSHFVLILESATRKHHTISRPVHFVYKHACISK